MKLPYWIVDAFTDRIFSGNPASVVLPGSVLPDRLMQCIAAENNLSETAFAVREGSGIDAVWHLRWFTPTVEVDLCGHATLATAFVLNLLKIPGPYRFRTRSGVLTATEAGRLITLDFPARDVQRIQAPACLYDALGMQAECVLQSADLIAVLPSAQAVRDLRPEAGKILALPGGALIVTARGDSSADIVSRYFAPAYGIAEDPVTGSLHTQIVPYWARVLGKSTLGCEQASARGGFMTCTHAPPRVTLTGAAVLYASGAIECEAR